MKNLISRAQLLTRARAALFALPCLWVVAPEAFACRCQTPPPSRAYARAAAVVVAKAVSVEARPEHGQEATLEVSAAWKRDVAARLTVLGGGDDCGHFFEPGQEYVLYLFVDRSGAYTTANCVGNKFFNNPKLPPRFAAYARQEVAWLKRHGKPAKVG